MSLQKAAAFFTQTDWQAAHLSYHQVRQCGAVVRLSCVEGVCVPGVYVYVVGKVFCSAHVCVRMHVYVCVRMHVRMHVYVYVRMYVYVYVRMYVYVYVRMYVYV